MVSSTVTHLVKSHVLRSQTTLLVQTEQPFVTLISGDGQCSVSLSLESPSDASHTLLTTSRTSGHRFILPRSAALGSTLVSDALTGGSGGFAEAQAGVIHLEEQRAEVVEKVAEYLMYKDTYTNAKQSEEIPDFKDRVRPEIALEL